MSKYVTDSVEALEAASKPGASVWVHGSVTFVTFPESEKEAEVVVQEAAPQEQETPVQEEQAPQDEAVEETDSDVGDKPKKKSK